MRPSQWKSVVAPITAGEVGEAIAGQQAVVVYLWAGWDMQGRVFDLWLDALRRSLANRLVLHSVDVDSKTGLEMADRFSVVTTPTILFFLNGKLAGRHDGRGDKPELQARLQSWQEAASTAV